MDDLSRLTSQGLLALHARVSDELRNRGITKTRNNPAGGLAEYLFCKAFGWNQFENSIANVDAIDDQGTRYQIKGRHITQNGSRQLGAIRDLGGEHFDFLAGVPFSEDYTVMRAAIIPRAVVVQRASFQKHTNSHRFLLRDDVWDALGVRDVTEKLRAVKF